MVTEQEYKDAWRRMGRCDAAVDAQRFEARVTSALVSLAEDAANAAIKDRRLSGDRAHSFRDGFVGVPIKMSNPRKNDTEADYRAGKALRAQLDAQMRTEARALVDAKKEEIR